MYDALAEAKRSKAGLHSNPIEGEAGALLAHVAARPRENL
jgi:hypothetical protein